MPTLSYKGKLVKQGKDYVIDWSPDLVFPHMKATDKISFSEEDAIRGKILDKNGNELATNCLHLTETGCQDPLQIDLKMLKKKRI